LRSSTRFTPSWYISFPSISTDPSTRAELMRSFIRLRHRRNVDFPQPDGPMSAVTLFSGMSIDTDLMAWSSP